MLNPTVTVAGRPGHAEMPQPDWREGGAVNAIEKTTVVLEAVRTLRERWRERDGDHPLLAPGDLVPTVIQGGEWWVNYPASCTTTVDVTYLPRQGDHGNGDDGAAGARELEREIEAWILERAREDPWLAEHPPSFEWGTNLAPAEISPEHPIVDCALAAGAPSVAPAGGRAAGLARRGHLHPVRDADDQLRPRRALERRQDDGPRGRRVRPGRGPGRLRAGDRARGGRPLRSGRVSTPRIANPDDAAVVTRLLKAFFSHEGREVRHLRQNVEAILYDPGRGFFTLAGDAAVATTTTSASRPAAARAPRSRRSGCSRRRAGRGLGASLLRNAVDECRRRGSSRSSCGSPPTTASSGIPDFYTKQGFRHRGLQIMEFSGE